MAKAAALEAISDSTTCRELSDCSAIVTCPICVDHFVDGRSLPCSHTFCLHCLHDYQQSISTANYCPTCRKQTVPPKDKLNSLPVNTFANAVAYLVRKYQPSEGE